MTQLDLQQKLERAEAETRFIGGALAICQKDISECREVMSAVIEERDALQQQVNALATENLALKELAKGYADLADSRLSDITANCESDCRRECYEECNKTPATDAIKSQWMAEGVEQFAAFWESRCRHNDTFVGGEASNYAAQLRQSEEKGHE